MRRLLCSALVAALLCGGAPVRASDRGAQRAPDLVPAGKPRVYGLYSLNKSGEFGTATFTPIVGGRTEVDIALVAAPADLQPVNIYAGTCSKLDPRPRYALNYVVSGISQTLLPVDITTLTGGELAVNVHKSTNDVEMYVACGAIVGK